MNRSGYTVRFVALLTITIGVVASFVLFAGADTVGAQTEYNLLQPIGDDLSETYTAEGDVSDYVSTIFQLALGLASVLAVLMIVIGGIQIMTSGSIDKQTDARDRIQQAILGLVLALGSWLVLFTINPGLLEFDFELGDIGTFEGAEAPDISIERWAFCAENTQTGTMNMFRYNSQASCETGEDTADTSEGIFSVVQSCSTYPEGSTTQSFCPESTTDPEEVTDEAGYTFCVVTGAGDVAPNLHTEDPDDTIDECEVLLDSSICGTTGSQRASECFQVEEGEGDSVCEGRTLYTPSEHPICSTE